VTTIYPTDLDACVTLANGARVRIRALRRCEGAAIRELYAHLSPRSRYFRFLSPMPSLPDSVVRLLSCVDYRRKLALVAEYEAGDARDIVALGSFDAIDESSAEVGLVVRDDWQRQRIGLALAQRVLQAAEERGYHRFVASVHVDNVAMRGLLRHLGRVVSSTFAGGVSELSFVRHPAAGPLNG